MKLLVRTIKKEDDPIIEKIIKSVLVEHGMNKPGTIYYDNTLTRMTESHAMPGSIYYVGMENGNMIGGAGIYPTDGLPPDTCELVKMYILPGARGKGFGKVLVNKCIEFAKEQGYKKVYLETMEELKNAVNMYERSGFSLLPGPLGNTGHFACTIRMIKEID